MAKHNFTFSKVRKMIARVDVDSVVILPKGGVIEVHKQDNDDILTFVWSADGKYVKGFRKSEYADMGTYAEGIARTVRRRVGDVNVDTFDIFSDLPKEPKAAKKAATKRNKAKKEAVAAIA